MTLEQINSLTVEDVFPILLSRILDTENLPEGAPIYLLDQDDSLPFYDRVIVHQSLVKPPLANLESELAEYKLEQAAIEQARLDEIARVQGLTDRFNAIGNIRAAIARAGFEISNPAIELKRIIKENDETRLAAIEAASVEFEADQVAENQAKAEMAVADGLVSLCLGCVKIVMKHNIKNSLTKEQKDQQATDYADAFGALKDWRPGKFKSAVDAMTPDGTLVKQELKDELLSFLSENGL